MTGFVKRGILFLLAVLMLLSIAACTDGTGSKETTQTTTSSDTTSEIPDDDLPDVKFDGYEFNVIIQSNSGRQRDIIYNEEVVGNQISELVNKRNRDVEDRFGITIKGTADTHQNVVSTVRNLISAGDYQYDLVFSATMYMYTLATQGNLLPMDELEYVNLMKPWWGQDILEGGFTINHKTYLVNGDISPTSLLRSALLIFNKTLCDENNIAYPYQTVYDGKWTLDEMIRLTKDFTRDTNGDGEYDLFGLTSWFQDSPYSFYYGAGGQMVYKDDNDMPYLNTNREKDIQIYDKIFTLILENRSNFEKSVSGNAYQVFIDGNALFVEASLHQIERGEYRNMDDDWGVLPLPKLNETDEYRSFVNSSISMIGVPVNAPNPERTSIIMEALASTSYRMVTPQLVNVLAKSRYTQDKESQDMLDIVFRNRVYDLAYIDQTLWNKLSFVKALLSEGSKSVASFFASVESSVNERINEIKNFYENQE